MTMLDPDDLGALEELWNLPSPRDGDHSYPVDEKARRNAMYEYCYAKRDHLQHHLGEGERMLKAVLADIERLHEEERQELGTANKKSLRRRVTDRSKR
jgi:hypothetical protein